ncbi:mitogen-activated protein kinase kinase kinase 1-like [Mangifera indica]|uniref:mitogen-activated protein kinase kinase kinase 1-like n=1 Tax=Mangifera indica TaxID=29780 RepID=UPI001CFBB37B|nr:mitogen-activated protein kinase kinase kinase 1-like [Mangifera indica]
MNRIPQIFTPREKTAADRSMDPRKSTRKPRLQRRNAAKNFEYDASSSSSCRDDSSPSASRITRSLDLSDRTSFRIEGVDGEFERICRSLGLSGPEDFAIPAAAWESRKIRSSSDLLPRSRLNELKSPKETEERQSEGVVVNEISNRVLKSVRITDEAELTRNESVESSALPAECPGDTTGDGVIKEDTDLTRNALAESSPRCIVTSNNHIGGIKGVRPPLLKPPPAMTLPVIDNTCSTWDILKAFAPKDDKTHPFLDDSASSSSDEEGEEEYERKVERAIVKREEEIALSESCSFTTSNDDDSSSTTTEPTTISPNGRFRRTITYWEKGELLGRGTFGSVYEGISDDGFFFAVKEVSLLDQGSQGKQSIYQLEQEIALLSQFEHENIVRYLGTDKDESKLYIFLELVTKGSLLNLYLRYHLRDSQVSAYTRQILNGLKYLHDQNVVHRDIKCANILVDASGYVKLADFGLAKATKLNDVKSCKGTAFWMAPEVVNNKNQGYGLAADIWSLGCTVLEMLTRKLPYYPLECMPALFKIGRGLPPLIPDSLSTDARDFVGQCLQVNPKDRPTAAHLLEHPFVKRRLSTSSGSASPYLGRRN